MRVFDGAGESTVEHDSRKGHVARQIRRLARLPFDVLADPTPLQVGLSLLKHATPTPIRP